MTQTFNISFGQLVSFVVGLSVFFGASHAKDISAFTLPTYSKVFNTEKSGDSSLKNQQNTYKIQAELHNHIDRQTLKSMLSKANKQTPQADAKSLHRNRHSAPKKVSKKQKHSDAWHMLLRQGV